MVRISTVRQSDPIIGVGTASPTDPVSSILKRYREKKKTTATRRISHKSYKENRNTTTCA